MKRKFTVRQGALDGVEAALGVAAHRNFRKAAAELGVTPSAISQTIRALEARIGAALFIRTTRSVGLTEAGERFIARAKPAFEELIAAGEAADELGQRPTGLLRLSVPRAVVPLILEPVIASFRPTPRSSSRSPQARSSSTSRPKALTPAFASVSSLLRIWSRCG
jgi:DNA-binding transcriptional LysR family regulator